MCSSAALRLLCRPSCKAGDVLRTRARKEVSLSLVILVVPSATNTHQEDQQIIIFSIERGGLRCLEHSAPGLPY